MKTRTPMKRASFVPALTAGALGLGLAPVAAAAGQTPAEISLAGHVLRRVQHSAPLADYPAVLPTGTTSQITQIVNYLLNQLSPAGITENAETTSLLGLYTVPPTGFSTAPPPQPGNWSINDLADTNLVRAVWSEKKLCEVMTRFWQEHFTTNYFALTNYFFQKFLAPPYSYTSSQAAAAANQFAAYFEAIQNDKFRLNCVGTFANLLLASAQGEAMMIYLDTVGSNAPLPNQNYARELLELHTLGLKSPFPAGSVWVELYNYSFQDILRVAEILSGWTLVDTGTPTNPNFVFSFTPTTCTGSGATAGHWTQCPAPGTKTLFNAAVQGTSPAVGLFNVNEDQLTPSEGLALINHLANSPVTAYHISKKLYKLFISDVEPALGDPLLLNCVTAWYTTPGGDINAVLQTLFSSNEFLNDTTKRWNVERQPIDCVAQTVALFHGRAFDPNATPAQNRARITNLRFYVEEYGGQELFRYGPPDGFPRGDYEMLTTNRILGTTRLRQELYTTFNLATLPWPAPGVPGLGWDYFAVLSPFVNFADETSLTNWFTLMGFTNDQTAGDTNHIWYFFRSDLTGVITPVTLLQELLAGIPGYVDRLTSSLAFVASSTLNNLK